jgi:hypothetical protein
MKASDGTRMEHRSSGEITVTAVTKKYFDGTQERYVFLFDEKSRTELVQTLGRFARDPDLSFDWPDVLEVFRSMRKPGTLMITNPR